MRRHRDARFAGGAAWILVALLGAAGAAAAAEPVVTSGAQDRSALVLTIYNQDLALVREVRRVDLPDGNSRLEFQDVPAQIEPRSLLVETAKGRGMHLREQNYEYDLMSKEKILEKYVGREVAWLQEDGSRITGTLLGMTQGPVYRVGGEIVFDVPGRIALPELPEDLRARPTLVWEVAADGKGSRDLDVSYLTRGVSWSADYVLQLDDAGTTGDLQGWVSVDNKSGATYRDARLTFLAGDVHRAAPPSPRVVYKAAQLAREADAGMAEEAVSDYHLYTYGEATTLKEKSVKQLSLLSASGVKVTKHYRFGNGQVVPRGASAADPGKVAVWHVFENRAKNGLGVPLPAGTVRVYGRSSSGARQLLGEDRIDHTPKDETVELLTGYAFDVTAERIQTADSKRGTNSRETAWSVLLKNHGDENIVVEVSDSSGGEWEILASSLPFVKVDAHRFRFDVPVAAGGETTLTYRVLSSW